jgi:hypothetical protein
MFLKTRLAAFIAALAVGAPVATAGAATSPAAAPVNASPSCPVGYAGPTNLATGCPFWLMTPAVQLPQ